MQIFFLGAVVLTFLSFNSSFFFFFGDQCNDSGGLQEDIKFLIFSDFIYLFFILIWMILSSELLLQGER